MLRVLVSRVLDLVLRRSRDARLDEEIRGHLEMLASDYMARGMPAADARAAARRAFGGVSQTKEACRDRRGLPVLDALAQDVRFALRLLRRNPGYTLTAALVLGIGIGVNNMFFTIVNAHTIRGLPLTDADSVIHVSSFSDRTPDMRLSYPDFLDMRSAAAGVVDLAGFVATPVAISGDALAAERLEAAYVSEDAFQILGIAPLLGRDFSSGDNRPGAPAVVLLGAGTWASRFGSDNGVIGRPVLINGQLATVVGIMPDRAGFPSTADVWLPLATMPGFAGEDRGARSLAVYGRLRAPRSVAESRVAIESIAERLAIDHPATNRNVRARVVPINERFLGSLTHPAWRAFMAAGILVVLISCANAANLVLARSVQRTREVAIRSSLGASRPRVLRQLLVEGAVLAAIGGLAGFGFAAVGIRIFSSAIPENVLPYWLDYTPDSRVLTALVVVSAGAVLLFALLPAVRASKSDATRVLKEGGPGATSTRSTQRWATVFLAAEFGLAVVLLSQLSLALRSPRSHLPSDDAIDTRQVLTAVVSLPPEQYPSPDRRWEFHVRLQERLRAMSAITAGSAASTLPVNGAPEERLEVEGRESGGTESGTRVHTVHVAPGYFEALGLTLVAGRDFSESDGGPGQDHAIVNERLARLVFAEGRAVGERISFAAATDPSAAPRWRSIIGVAPDIRQRPVRDPDPVVYLPYRETAPATSAIVVRSDSDAAALSSTLRAEVHALDSNLPLYRVRTLAQAVRDATWNGRLSARLIQMITLIAVALSTLGLYAVTMYGVSQRTHEIGLRMALGARPRHIAAGIFRRAAIQLAAGLLAGIACTMLWDRMFLSSAPTLRAAEPRSLLFVVAVLAGLAIVACTVPIRRAVRLDPRTAMMSE